MFKRLNTGGESLSAQEVRNATIRLLDNRFNQFIIEMSRNEDFRYCITTVSDNQKNRKFDQELVLRFFAFKNNFGGYKHEVEEFLTEYMESVSDPADDSQKFDYESEQLIFEKTFRVLRTLADAADVRTLVFGSVTQGSTEPRGQFSVYHFEGLTLGIQAVLDKIDLGNPGQLRSFAEVLKMGKADREFLRNTGAGKNDPNPLRERVNFFIEKFGEAKIEY